MGEGTLARSSVLGSAPRVMVEHVREAEWTPDGSDLAVVRRVEGLERLELPLGKVLYQTSGYISDVRFSPSGDRIAFADHQFYADDAGAVAVVDREGHRTVLSEGWTSIHGIAWSRGGTALWFGATRGGTIASEGVYAVTLDGKLRPLIVGPTRYKVLDIASDGRVLLNLDLDEKVIEALMADSPNPVNIEFGASSSSVWVANDGKSLLISDQSTASYDTYLLRAGGAPVHLGTGAPIALSPDGRWALTQPVAGYPLFLHPTGPGQSRTLSDPENIAFDLAGWLDDGHIVGFGQKQGQRSRGYVQDTNGGAPRPFTPEGVHVVGGAVRWWSLAVSPDGTRVIAAAEDETPMIFRIDGGAPEPIRNLRPGEVPVQWTPDGRGLLVAHGNGLPWTIERQDLATGQRSPAATIRAHDQAGLRLSIFEISRDAKYYVHTYTRLLSDLYVVDGLK
jgi:WD40 repeat protein